jgi:hypothetical protein
MSAFSKKITAAGDFRVRNAQNRLTDELRKIKEQAIRTQQTGSSRYEILLIEPCIQCLRAVGDILWECCEEYLKQDVFLVLSTDEDQLIKEMVQIFQSLYVWHDQEFKNFSSKPDQADQIAKALEQVFEEVIMYFKLNMDHLFNAARGL